MLVFRHSGQGKRCTICACLDEELLHASTAEAKQVVMAKKKQHIDSVMADHAVNVRGNALAEMHARNPSPFGHDTILKLVVDGMDQAKFRTPRCVVGLGPDERESCSSYPSIFLPISLSPAVTISCSPSWPFSDSMYIIVPLSPSLPFLPLPPLPCSSYPKHVGLETQCKKKCVMLNTQ